MAIAEQLSAVAIPDELRQIDLDRCLVPLVDRQRDDAFLDRLGQSLLKQGWMHPFRCQIELTGKQEAFRTLTGWGRVLAGRRVGLKTGPGLILHRQLTESEILLDVSSENELRSETKEVDRYRIFARLRELNDWSNLELAIQTHTSAPEVCKIFKRCELLPGDLVALIGTGVGKLSPRAAYALSLFIANGGDDVAGWAIEHASELTDVDRFDAFCVDPLSYALELRKLADDAVTMRERRSLGPVGPIKDLLLKDWRSIAFWVGCLILAALVIWRRRRRQQMQPIGV